MTEIWKDIKGFEGLYQVSNLGNIKSLEKIRIMPNGGNRIYSQKILIPVMNRNNYLSVQLCKDGIVTRHLVHRLVAMQFINNPLSKPQINHIDGNKSNNIISNLEWNTPKENIQHSFNNNLNPKQRAVNQYTITGELVNTFISTREAERITHINHTGISYCAIGHYKQYKGFIWRYSE